ncbi:MAG TPA: serpin family protein [Pontiella sp.]|nr:serpin family protein [Pontiella sp.]
MKKLLLFVLLFTGAVYGHAEPIPADDILAFVRTKLPDDPLTLTGSLKVKTKNGFTRSSMPVVMELDWGAAVPTATYRIDEETLTITWKDGQPDYAFSNPDNHPGSMILDTGITWADLSFSVLWWADSKLVREEKKINRDCYVVDVPVPDSDNSMRLWIEKKMGMLLEARTFDAKQKELSRMKIVSIKKTDGMWVAKDLEIRDRKTGSKTTLQISDLVWKHPRPSAAAFDPAVSVNELAFDLYEELSAENEENLFFSPYSISSALAMTYGGARGETAGQMEETLHYAGQDTTHPALSYLRKTLNSIEEKGHAQLSVANALWPQKDYPFSTDYLALTQEFYGSEVRPVDYQADPDGARGKINSWVEEQTNNKIQGLIAEGVLSPLTRLVLANAIYFKGNWARQFKKENTQLAPFTLSDGTRTDVPMMSRTGDYKLARTAAFQALELPYEGGDLSMFILLPNPGEALELEFPAELEFNEMEVMVQLPRFKLEAEFYLGSTLAALGMPLAFSTQADFSGMDGSRNLFIDEVIHKAFVEVNEEGTEAAAATAVGIRTTSMPPQFEVNRPFLFLINENSTGTILFIGRVNDPR